MRFITLTVVAAVLIEGYLSASLNGPLEDSKKLVKRQAHFSPNFMPPNMGGFRPNIGPPGMMSPHMGGFGPNMGPPGMMPPNMLPPDMFHPSNENFADAQASNSSDGQSFGYSYSTDQNGNPVSSSVVTNEHHQ